MTEQKYDPKAFALELGFSEEDAELFRGVNANATNLRRLAKRRYEKRVMVDPKAKKEPDAPKVEAPKVEVEPEVRKPKVTKAVQAKAKKKVAVEKAEAKKRAADEKEAANRPSFNPEELAENALKEN